MPEEVTENHDRMIWKFQTLIEKGVFSQTFDFFPYPIAIFTPLHTLVAVNRAFLEETKMLADTEKRAVRIFQYKIEDIRLASAVSRVFKGGAFVLEYIKNPFDMFEGLVRQSTPQPGRFKNAAVFPIPAENTEITHGVIAFIP